MTAQEDDAIQAELTRLNDELKSLTPPTGPTYQEIQKSYRDFTCGICGKRVEGHNLCVH